MVDNISDNDKGKTEELDTQHIELARLLAMGHKFSEIAARLGVSDYWVRTHRNIPAVINLVAEFREEAMNSARGRIAILSDKAVSVIENILEYSSDDKVKLNAAKDVLDRFGVTRKEEKKIKIEDNLSEEDTEELMKKLKNRLLAVQGEDEDED